MILSDTESSGRLTTLRCLRAPIKWRLPQASAAGHMGQKVVTLRGLLITTADDRFLFEGHPAPPVDTHTHIHTTGTHGH